MKMIVLLVVRWLLKSGTYWLVFRRRTIKATVMDCLIIAGAPLIISGFAIPLPSFLMIPVSMGVAVYLTMHYTGVELIPDGLFIPLGIEIGFMLAFWLLQEFEVI